MTALRRRPIGVTLTILTLGSIGGCSATGSATPTTTATDQEPSPSRAASGSASAPAPSAAASPTATTASAGPAFRLTSSAFADGAAIPRRYTCDGADVSPPLAWEGAPAEAKALVLIVDDPDARGFVHWVMFDLPGTPSGQLAEGASTSPNAPPQGTNSFGRVGWGGPCPPSGTHHYRFRLIALRQALNLRGAPTAAEVLKATAGLVLAETTLVGVYNRG